MVADLAPRSVVAANSVDTRFGRLGFAPAGALPDMATVSGGGRYVLAANDGGPRNRELPDGVRFQGSGATVAQDLEPDCIATDGNTPGQLRHRNPAAAGVRPVGTRI